MLQFLIEFDSRTVPARVTTFEDVKDALAALSIAERNAPPGVEVVLLGADSEEVLHVTHPGYFEDPFTAFRRTVRDMTDAALERLDRTPVGTR